MKKEIKVKEVKTMLIGSATESSQRYSFHNGLNRSVATRIVYADSSFELGGYGPAFSVGSKNIDFGCQSTTIDEIKAALDFLEGIKLKTRRLLTKGGKPTGPKVLSPVREEVGNYYITENSKAYPKDQYSFADVPEKSPKRIRVMPNGNVHIAEGYTLGKKEIVIDYLKDFIEVYNFLNEKDNRISK